MPRRISSSLRAKALIADDWAALNSSTTINRLVVNTTKMAIAISAATGTTVVYATDWLQKYRTAELEAKLEAKIDAKMDKLEAKIDATMDKLEAKIDAKMDNVIGKLFAIDEQLRSRGKWTWGWR